MRLRAIHSLPEPLQHYVTLLALPPQRIIHSHSLLFTPTRAVYDALILIPRDDYPEGAALLQLKTKDIDKLKSRVAQMEAAEFIRGSDLLNEDTGWDLGVGIDSVDELLIAEKGRGSQVLEIRGGRDSGKTVRSFVSSVPASPTIDRPCVL